MQISSVSSRRSGRRRHNQRSAPISPLTISPTPASLKRIDRAKWLSWLVERGGFDRAVTFALLTRLWQLAAGPISLLFIAHFFTPEAQGFYYTFASLLALQVFFELGLSVIVINVASHEWSNLRLNADGCIEGSPDALSRLTSFGRQLFRRYGTASAIFLVGAGAAGLTFPARPGPPTTLPSQRPCWA